jgi:O-antigen/teichoic acid export membrane protein
MVSGCCATIGWVTLIVVARIDEPASYASFAVLWAMYYFSAGALSGLQQEVTRSAITHERQRSAHSTSVRRLGVCIGLSFAALVAGSYALWGTVVDASWLILLPMTCGAVSLALFITVLGVLSAQGRWGVLAGVLAGDALLRLGAVGLVGTLTDSAIWYAFAIMCGSLTWVPVIWLPGQSSTRVMLRERWERRGLFRRSFNAMASTACAALLIAGLPWLMALTSREHDSALSASLLAALVLFRSPVLVLSQGLRPVILRAMLEEEHSVVRHFWQAVATYGAVSLVVTGGAYVAGPWLLSMTFGSSFHIGSVHAAVLVFSAVLLALATHLNLAIIAVDRHRKATEGWLLAVATTVSVLLLPFGLTERLMWAAVLGPVAGLALMLWAWARITREGRTGRWMIDGGDGSGPVRTGVRYHDPSA